MASPSVVKRKKRKSRVSTTSVMPIAPRSWAPKTMLPILMGLGGKGLGNGFWM